MFKYSVSIKWSDDDEGFIAFVPELPGLSAFGNSPQEAAAELEIAEEAYLESLREAGEAIPAPETYVPYSGQIRLRMPKSLHAKLAQAATEENVSLNTYLVSLLSEGRSEKRMSELVKSLTSAFKNQHILNYQSLTADESLITRADPGFEPFMNITVTKDATNEIMRRIH